MAIAANQIVSIEYEVKSNGEVVDSNVGGELLTFMIGKEQVIPGLEEKIAEMSMGDVGEISVPAEKAYGEYNDEALQEVPKEQFAGIELTQGMSLYGQSEDGGTVQVVVKEIKDDTVLVDYNHPLAGQTLLFAVTVSNVRDATAEELTTGIPAENAHSHDGGGCCSSEGDSADSGHGCGCN